MSSPVARVRAFVDHVGQHWSCTPLLDTEHELRAVDITDLLYQLDTVAKPEGLQAAIDLCMSCHDVDDRGFPFHLARICDLCMQRDGLRGRIDAALAIDPADHATKSRDYGRGFAEALRLVHQALEEAPGT